MSYPHIQASFEKYPEINIYQHIVNARAQAQEARINPHIGTSEMYGILVSIAKDIEDELEAQDLLGGSGHVLINNEAFFEEEIYWSEDVEDVLEAEVPPPLTLRVPLKGPIFGSLLDVYVRDSNEALDSEDKICFEIKPVYTEELARQGLQPEDTILLPLDQCEEMLHLHTTAASLREESNFLHMVNDLADVPPSRRTPQHINAIFNSIVNQSVARSHDKQVLADWVIDRFNDYLQYRGETLRIEAEEAIVYEVDGQDTATWEIVQNSVFEGEVEGFIDIKNYKEYYGTQPSQLVPYYRPSCPLLGLVLKREYEDDKMKIIHIPLKRCRKFTITPY